MNPFLSLLQRFRFFRTKVLWAGFCSVWNKIFDIAPEILIGIAIDVVVRADESFLAGLGVKDPWDQICVLGVLTFFIWAGESLFEFLLLKSWRELAQAVQHELRRDCYQHVQSLDLSYFEDKSTGNLVAVLNDDINQLERFLDGGANQLIQTMVAVLGVGAVFFAISPQIALFAFLPIPIIVFGAFFFQSRVEPLYALVREKAGAIASRLNNNISGIMTIKSFNQEVTELEKIESLSRSYLEANRRAILVSSSFIPLIRMAILAGFLTCFLMGAKMVIDKELPVGMYGVLVFLTQRLLWPLTGLAATIDLYQRAKACMQRILDLMDSPISIRSGSFVKEEIEGTLEIDNLSFQYATGTKVLSELHLCVPKGNTVAFVGSTGSGKSTLLKLLMRFYDTVEGEIRLDGRDLKDYSLDFLRGQIGFVSQDVFLFHGTVFENIAYSKPNSTIQEVIAAAKAAEAHDFIQLLPDAYNTWIGERGQKLSGGQRQRLSLARAILRDPKILILDEATSAIDNETEAAIQKSLLKITKGRTTILVAHRLSTVVHADRIFVLENGKVVEEGKHIELLSKEGLYRKLWNVQTGDLADAKQGALGD